MCAHYDPQTDPARLKQFFGVSDLPLGLKPSLWPGYHGPFVRKHEFAGVGDEAVPFCELLVGSFGLIPHWAKDTNIARNTYNARSETVHEKPSYRDAWRLARHCIIPAEATGLAVWREQPLDETPYVFLDARYERVREGGQLVDCAVLVAVGITHSGHRRVLGVSVALSEAEVHWRAFLDSLVRRGLKGVKMIVADAHAGLNAARRATLPSVPWQRCQFHLQQNAQSYVTRLDQRKPVAQRIRAIFNAPDKTEAERLLRQAIEGWRTEAPKPALWAEQNLPEGFAAFSLPVAQRVRLRTTNGLERINREIKRRTRVASIFPNTASCLRLVSALLAECDEDWMTGKIYLNLKD